MKIVLILMGFCVSFAVHADTTPVCMAHGRPIAINNDQVIQWKTSTPDQYHDRGHIHGTLQRVFPDYTGHHHLEILLTSSQPDTIELIYNEDFGPTPPLVIGANVEACGDYITSNLKHPVSPDGAILHWLHRSPYADHESGFLEIDGVVTGQN